MTTNLKTLLIVKQILLVRTSRDVKRTVWRICILMSGLKSLTLSLARGKTCQVLDPYLKLLRIHSQHFFNQPHSGRVLSFLTEDETERKLLNKGC